MRVDGGPTNNNFLMQFQADMINSLVIRNSLEELSAMGSAFMAGLAVDIWKNTDEIRAMQKTDRIFKPIMKKEVANELYVGYRRAVERAL